MKQDSLLNDFQTCLNLFKFNMIWIAIIHMILKHVWTGSNMSKLDQIQYDMNCCDSYDSQTHVQTCPNLFRFNMIWIVTIHTIFKHVCTCSNMSKLVQIQYDINCYDPNDYQTCLNTCLNLFRFNMIWCLQYIQFSNMYEHVQTCLNLFRFNMIWIVTIHAILKHV